MGQRLVVHFMTEEKEIANIYFHWSAYTSSSLEILNNFSDTITNLIEDNKYFNNLNDYLKVILIIEKINELYNMNIGFFPEEDIKYINLNLPIEIPRIKRLPEADNRNDGLVYIIPSDIDNANSWSEGDIFINISTYDVEFNVFYIENKQSIEEAYDEDDIKDIVELDDITINSLSSFNIFDESAKESFFINWNHILDTDSYIIKLKGDNYCGIIG